MPRDIIAGAIYIAGGIVLLGFFSCTPLFDDMLGWKTDPLGLREQVGELGIDRLLPGGMALIIFGAATSGLISNAGETKSTFELVAAALALCYFIALVSGIDMIGVGQSSLHAGIGAIYGCAGLALGCIEMTRGLSHSEPR